MIYLLVLGLFLLTTIRGVTLFGSTSKDNREISIAADIASRVDQGRLVAFCPQSPRSTLMAYLYRNHGIESRITVDPREQDRQGALICSTPTQADSQKIADGVHLSLTGFNP